MGKIAEYAKAIIATLAAGAVQALENTPATGEDAVYQALTSVVVGLIVWVFPNAAKKGG